MGAMVVRADDKAVARICDLDWRNRSEHDMVAVAWAYYYFSVQFRESLEICCAFYPDDQDLARLKLEECDTSNLSPFPGVALPGEKMNHDEFMRRLLELSPVSQHEREFFETIGEAYLAEIRNIPEMSRALSMGSYEDGGLESVFKAMLRAPDYDNPLLEAFRFFLTSHIAFDSDQNAGHGSLSRHLVPDENIVAIWDAFGSLLHKAVPAMAPLVHEHEH
jgi:hypothetical protein